MSHYADQNYETSICSLGVIGTRYVRDGEPLPASITSELTDEGEHWRFELQHIKSEIEIGTELLIEVS